MDGAIWEYVVHLSMQSIFFDLLTVKCLQLKSQNNRKLKEKSPLPPKPPKFPSTFSDEPVSSAGDYDSPISVLSVSPIIIVSAGFIVIPINDIIDVKNIIFMIPENINHWNPCTYIAALCRYCYTNIVPDAIFVLIPVSLN